MAILELIDFVPGQATPSGSAALDSPNRRIVLNSSDVAAGGLLEIFTLTLFIRAIATDAEAAAAIAAAEQGGSDGILAVLFKDESIVSFAEAEAFAASKLAELSPTLYELNFTTRVDGFEPGMQLRFIDDIAIPPIDVVLTIQSVSEEYRDIGDNGEDEFAYTIRASSQLQDSADTLANSVILSNRPPKPRGAIIAA